MKHRHRALAACLAAALAIAACGGDDGSSDPATTTAAPAAATTAAADGADTTVADTVAPGDAATTTAAPAGSTGGDRALTATDIADRCASEPLEATEVGITADQIVIEVAADTGAAVAPGMFQANVDAIVGFADYVNANGGLGCRQLVVRTWDTKLDPVESKNAQIDACQNAVAMVGGNSLFNGDITAMAECTDQAGNATGLPNVAALAADSTELCAPTTYTAQYRVEQCPITPGQPRTFTWPTGAVSKLQELQGDLHGIYLIPASLPSTRQTGAYEMAELEAAGITWDGHALVSGGDAQASFVPYVQILKQSESNFVYNGSNDTSMVSMQKEARAQGLEGITYACAISCYTRLMLTAGGDIVDGTYVWLQFLPFEEADTNEALADYLDAVGTDKADSFGAQAWQSAIAFQQVVNQIVADHGPNAITREAILAGLDGLTDFTADGWAGAKSLRGVSDCYVLLQITDGEFQRVWPTERGTLDCSPDNVSTVTIDPVAVAEQF